MPIIHPSDLLPGDRVLSAAGPESVTEARPAKSGTYLYEVVSKPRKRKGVLTVNVMHRDGGETTRAWDEPDHIWLVVQRKAGEAQPERT